MGGLFFFLKRTRFGFNFIFCLSCKIRANFASLIFLDRFWLVHIALVRIIKHQSFAYFAHAPISYPVISTTIFTFLSSVCCVHVQWLTLSFPNLHKAFIWYSRPYLLLSLLLLLLFTPQEFFSSVLADCFSQEFEGQPVFSSLQDSSQYSGRPQHWIYTKTKRLWGNSRWVEVSAIFYSF